MLLNIIIGERHYAPLYILQSYMLYLRNGKWQEETKFWAWEFLILMLFLWLHALTY